MKSVIAHIGATVLLLVAIAATPARAADPLVEKKKTYSKTYTLSASDRVRLTNQFGELKIIPWDKNEIRVDVTIVTKASAEDIAQRIMDGIRIEDGKNGSEVFFRTKMDESKNKWDKSRNKDDYKEQNMRIDYAVYMPTRSALYASNSFGPMVLPDYPGQVELESKFGSLTTGKLANPKSVSVEFGTATIESANGGNLTVKFSKAQINTLSGSVVLRVEFSDALKIGMTNAVSALDLKCSYSQVYVDVPNTLSANFVVHTSFGDFHNKTDFPIREEKEDNDRYGPKFDKDFSGAAGAGANKVKIRAEFGEVTLGHNLQVDMNAKKKKTKQADL